MYRDTQPPGQLVPTVVRDFKADVCRSLKTPHPKGTLQIGTAATATLFGRALAGGFGVAFDRSGNVAGYAYGGAGFGSYLAGNFGTSIQASTARFVSDLKGFFAVGSATLGGGMAGTADVFIGSSPHGRVAGAGGTFGPGGGGSIFGGVTNTVMTPSINVYQAISSVLGC